MDTYLLSKINQLLKKKRPVSSKETICTYYYKNTYLEISFENGQCSYDIQGTCTMCDYGIATTKNDVTLFINEMRRIFFSFSEKINSLMLCTNGSFLDDKQIPAKFQHKIMEATNQLSCKTILIETHCNNITDSKLSLIKNTIKNKQIKIELGLETTNDIYQRYILNKIISLEILDSTIDKIISYGFTPSLNILVGMPLLTTAEQITDVLNSINWCLKRNAEVVLFPINIKPYTLLYSLYENDMYQPISHWLLIHILSLVDECYLSKIDISYWGDRDDSYSNKKVIFPSACKRCRSKINNFYSLYLSAHNSELRKMHINSLLESADCNCYNAFVSKLHTVSSDSIDTRLEKLYEYLKLEYGEIV